MEHIVHLPEFRVVVCNKCHYAVLPSEIDSQFKPEKPHGFTKEARDGIVERVSQMDGLIQDQKELKQCKFPFPIDSSKPVIALGAPNLDGLRCIFDI